MLAPTSVLRKLTTSFVRTGIFPWTVAPRKLSNVVAKNAAIIATGSPGHRAAQIVTWGEFQASDVRTDEPNKASIARYEYRRNCAGDSAFQ